MSQDSHLAGLKRRHEDIDRQLREVQQRPARSDAEIVGLKRRKLRLKDEIAGYESRRRAA